MAENGTDQESRGLQLPWEIVSDDHDKRLGRVRVLNAARELVAAAQPIVAALIVNRVNGALVCPRCEGQEYDLGSCSLCGNLGWLARDGERFEWADEFNAEYLS